MIKVKHFMDAVEPDDGLRLWVEPFGLARNLRAWCHVHHVLPEVGPPVALWEWFEEAGPGGYEYFRGAYHDHLAQSPFRQSLLDLARRAASSNFTLLHQSEDPGHNTATALYEFLSELGAYCRPEE